MGREILFISLIEMATNPPKWDWHKQWTVRDRDQVYNPKNDRWVKRDGDGKFMDQKSDNDPFKGIRRHACVPPPPPKKK